MIETFCRPSYQRILVTPIASALNNKTKLSSNAITCFACISGIVGAFFIGLGHIYWGIASLLLSGYCDTLDGTLARIRQTTSPIGGILDIMSDRIVEFSIVFALYYLAPHDRAAICLFMLGAILLCVTSFLLVGIYSEQQSDKSFDYSPGLIDRFEAFLFFFAMILFPSYFMVLAIMFVVLVLYTTACRVWQFFGQL
jgi:archaetidylinositol phosphate synthase